MKNRMWKPLVLLLSLAASVIGESTLSVYKKGQDGTEIYKYKLGGYGSGSVNTQGFHLINGETKRSGDFTFVNVFTYPEYPGDDGSLIPKHDNFDVKVDICRADFRNGISTHILSASGCYEGLVNQAARNNLNGISSTRQHFYVSEKEPKRVRGKKIFINQCVQRGNRFTFARMSDASACPQGSRSVYSEPFYVLHASGTACPDVRRDNGYISTPKMVEDVFPSQIQLACNHGYEVRGETNVYCSNGRWEKQLGNCQRISCGRPTDLENGRIDGDAFHFEDRIRYSCDEGFDMVNPYSKTRTCSFNGQWNPEPAPTCNRKSCGSPGNVLYGSFDKIDGEKYGDEVIYQCDEGYRMVGDSKRLCTKEGTWTGSVPKCERIMCQAIRQPSNGLHDGSGTSSFSSGSVISFECHEGYELLGAPLLRCILNDSGDSAEWSNDAPICNAITCKAPQISALVDIEGDDFSFGKTIKFNCRDGFNIEGSSIARCTARGWDTEPPSCSAKLCYNPGQPDHGRREGDSFKVRSSVTFFCDKGYELDPQDSKILTCAPHGSGTKWLPKTVPTCEPVKCPTLPRLENGRLSTELFQFGHNITFECFPGYMLQGNPEISCQDNGQWDRQMPQCIACPRNHYKSGVNQDTCKQCPERSITLSPATTNIDHCMCEEGSSKEDDGTCVAIRCTVLTAPENGAISECEPTNGAQCVFSCDPGFILSGARQRRCLQSGWTGIAPVCTACPNNTYKAAEGSQTCIPCPINTHTEGKIGEALNSCVCEKGYSRPDRSVGGCYDVNECLVDNGGCEDRCINREGDYFCQCTRPGYTVNDDGKTCNRTKFCPPLEQDPDYGATVCHYNEEDNGNICYFRCQPGFFFVSGENDYVTCGSETRFKWSHQVLNETARLPACTREFFVDTQIPLTYEYETENTCDEIVASRDEIISDIMEVVNEFPTCKKRAAGGCGLKYLVLNCTEQEDGQKVVVSFEIFLKNPNEDEVGASCNSNCIRLNTREMLRDTLNLKNKFEETVTDNSEMLENLNDVQVAVRPSSFKFGRPRLLCVEEGRVFTKRRLCVPCGKGTFLPQEDAEKCKPCPIGTYQRKEGQLQCDKCLDGSTTAAEGSDHPSLCSVRVTEVTGRSRRKRSVDAPILTQKEVDEILAFLDEE